MEWHFRAVFGLCAFCQDLQLRDLAAELLRRGRSGSDVRAVLGGNFLRVAEAVWG